MKKALRRSLRDRNIQISYNESSSDADDESMEISEPAGGDIAASASNHGRHGRLVVQSKSKKKRTKNPLRKTSKKSKMDTKQNDHSSSSSSSTTSTSSIRRMLLSSEFENDEPSKDDDELKASLITKKGPMLPRHKVDLMLRGQGGFCYPNVCTQNNILVECNIPYVLPFGYQMGFVCRCGAFFSNGTAQSARAHIRGCLSSRPKDPPKTSVRTDVPPMDTFREEYYKGLYERPRYFQIGHGCGGQLGLMMHHKKQLVACVCGEINTYERFHSHFSECKYLESIWPKSREVECEIFAASPKVSKRLPGGFIDIVELSEYTKCARQSSNDMVEILDMENGVKFANPKGPILENATIPNEIHDITSYLRDLHEKITMNWPKLREQLLAQEDNGATPIQSERLMAKLLTTNKDKSVDDLPLWKAIDDVIDFGPNKMNAILAYAKKTTRDILGSELYSKGSTGTFSLILCDNTCPQGFHIDINETSKMFGMLISPGDDSTIVLQPQNNQTINNFADVANLLTRRCESFRDGNWVRMTKGLKQAVAELDKEEDTLGFLIENGFCDLLKIFSNDKANTEFRNDDTSFDYTTTTITNCPEGSCFCIDGKTIHAGSGAKKDSVRTILFWTWTRNEEDPYDDNIQHTPVSTIIEIAQEIWEKLESRKDKVCLTKIIAGIFFTTESHFRKDCPTLYQDTRFVHLFEYLAYIDKDNNNDSEDYNHTVSTVFPSSCQGLRIPIKKLDRHLKKLTKILDKNRHNPKRRRRFQKWRKWFDSTTGPNE